MIPILFACDLDNTLMYSYKHKLDGDICIEINKGQEQGFMSRKSHEMLYELLKSNVFVPVTTRSLEQYRRIEWPHGLEPTYAITTNGAILLKRTEIDEEWLQSSKEAILPYRSEIIRLYALLNSQDKYIRCRLVDDMYLFAYCKDGVSIDECAHEYIGKTPLLVIASGRKLYFLPPNITKGIAVKKLRNALNPKKVLCAGDSIIDLSMLNEADIALTPNDYLGNLVNGAEVNICTQAVSFSEFALTRALEMMNL